MGGAAGNKKQPATPKALPGKNTAPPSVTWLFKRASQISSGREPKAKELYELIGRLCQNAGESPEVCKQARQAVEAAVSLIREPKRMEDLEQALGYRPPRHHPIATAMTVAALDLDRIKEEGGDEGLKDRKKKSARKKKTVEASFENPFNKVTTVIASLLQEFVAYGALSEEEVKQKFGYDSDVAQLTVETSKITCMPISMRQPDQDGRLSLADIRFNKEQADLALDLILLMKNPVRVGMIKIAQALQQMRDLDHNRPLGSANGVVDIHLRTALHVREMYLPLVREAGMRDILREMKDLILQSLDPGAAEEIERQRRRIASPELVRATLKKIRQAIQRPGLGRKSIKTIKGGSKEVYSIWIKPFNKQFEDADKRNDEREKIEYAQAVKVDLSSIYDVLRFRIIFEDCRDINGQVDSRANEDMLRKFHAKLSKTYPAVPGRFKDHLGVKKKSNGYEALQDTFVINGSSVELHMVTQSMEDINEDNHRSYKQKTCKGAAKHPARFFSRRGHDRTLLLQDTLSRLFARLANDILPAHMSRDDIVVSDREGSLVSCLKGATLRDLVTKAFSMGWTICGKDGKPVPMNPHANKSACLKGALAFIEREDPGMLDRPLVHADTVSFVCFKPVRPGVERVLWPDSSLQGRRQAPGHDARL